MTEKDLINLDFTQVKDTEGASIFHYYTYDIGSLCLISSANDEVENDEWSVEVFNAPEISFTNPTEVSILLTLLTSNLNC